MFFEETNNVEQIEGVFADNASVEQHSRKLLQKLNSIFHKCFKKIRMIVKRNMKDDTIVYMEMMNNYN